MTPTGFHSLEGLTREERKAAPDVRPFVGDGTPYLKVPGLKKVTSVRIGRQDLPLEHTQDFPHPSNPKTTVSKTDPLVDLQFADDGTPVLLRSVQSNHGLWQAGVTVYVGGEWNDKKGSSALSPADKAATNNVVDEILKMPIEEIRKQAVAAKIADADKLEPRALAIALAKSAGYKFED
jgi:hypothetical protein